MKKRKLSGIVIAALMVLQMLPIGYLKSSAAVIPDNLTGADEYLVIHSSSDTIPSSLVITTAGGDPISPDLSGVYNDIQEGAKIVIDYAFHLEDGDGLAEIYTYSGSNYFEITLPDGIEFAAPTGDGANIYAEDSSGEEWIIATWSLSGNIIRVQFTAAVASHSSMWAKVHIEGTFEEIGVGDPDEVTIELGSQTVTIKREVPPLPTIELAKNCLGYDATENEVTWQVTVTPPSGVSLKGYMLVDAYGTNQTYKAGTFYVGAGLVDDTSLDTSVANQVSYIFPDDTDGIQTITYKTTPATFAEEDGSPIYSEFKNIANLYAGTTLAAGPAEDSIKLDWVSKSGAKAATTADPTIVKWTVTVAIPANASGAVSGAKIIDTIGSQVELIEGDTGHPIQLKIDSGTAATVDPGTDWGQYLYDPATGIITCRLPDSGSLTGSAILTFYTKAKDREDYLNSNSSKPEYNTAKLIWDGIGEVDAPSHKAGLTVIGSGGLVKKSASGGTEEYEYSDPSTIKWTITVNSNKISMTGVAVKDTIPDGQDILVDAGHPFTVTGSTTASFTDLASLSYINDASGESFTYTLGDISGTWTIVFYTKIIDTNTSSHTDTSGLDTLYKNSDNVQFKNNVTLIRTGESDINYSGTKTYKTQLIAKNAIGSYNYAEHTAKWSIVVNRSKLPLTGAVVTDTIPTGMVLLIDGAHPFTVAVNDGTAVDAAPAAGGNGSNSFTYNLGDIQDKYTITFYTLMEEDTLLEQWTDSRDFTNKAKLEAGEISPIEVSAKVSVTNPVIIKGYTREDNSDSIDWSVIINKAGIMLSGAYVEDALNTSLKLDNTSVKLYAVTVDSSGNVSVDGTIVDSADYSVTYPTADNGNKLTVTLPDGNGIYRLEFSTNILTNNLDSSNTVNMYGYNPTTNPSSTSLKVTVNNLWSSGGSGSITLTVHKEDGDGNPVQGAVYQLFNLNLDPIKKGSAVITAATDANGDAIFSNLPSWIIYAKEIETPDGYLLNDTYIGGDKLTTDLTYNTDDGIAVGDLAFSKTSTGGNPVSGGTFTLYDGTDNPVSTASSLSGTVTFKDIPLGSYTIKETDAPSGYYLSDTVLTATVTYNGDKTGVVTNVTPDAIVNKAVPGAVYGNIAITKTDVDGKALAGAEFTLYDEDGATVATAVSSADGMAYFSGVLKGSYTIKETKAPEGYTVSDEVLSVTISKDNKRFSFTVVNEKTPEAALPGEIVITKTDESGTPLAGAEFTLCDAGGTAVNTVVTGDDGKAVFDNVTAGSYTVYETRAPQGYTIGVTGAEVIVSSSQVSALSFKNEKLGEETEADTGSLQIKKTDEDYIPLSGAEFTLYDESGTAISKAISGEDGLVLFAGLAPGKYSVKETAAPAGYDLFTEPMTVEITSEQALYFTLRDTHSEAEESGVLGWSDGNSGGTPSSGGKLPQTGGIPDTFIMSAVGIFLFVLGVNLARPKKYIKKR